MKPLVSCIITLFEDFRDGKATKMKAVMWIMVMFNLFNSFAVELVLVFFVCKVVDVYLALIGCSYYGIVYI